MHSFVVVIHPTTGIMLYIDISSGTTGANVSRGLVNKYKTILSTHVKTDKKVIHFQDVKER